MARGLSINDFISLTDSSVTYASVDDAVKLVRAGGVAAELAKRGIESAFRFTSGTG